MFLHYFSEKNYHRLYEDYVRNTTEYEIVDTLGTGSYGVAYLLVHKHSAKKAVLKRLRAKHKKKRKTRMQFKQEIAFLKRLRIPNVPALLVEGEVGHIPFYIMEYIDGTTFEQLIFDEKQTFTVSETLLIGKELLEIVIAIHNQGIVHRDLRIPNILLQNGVLHVIDFGLSVPMKDSINLDEIRNPKKVENYISDLYYIGHFLLYLLYSNYTPSAKRERSWQEELNLPSEVKNYIERLLLIQSPFSSTSEAYNELLQHISEGE